METKIYNSKNIDFEYINHLLEKGEVISFPTETVYGLGCFYDDEKALKKIYELKGRDFNKPLLLHIKDFKEASKYAKDIPEEFYILAEKFLPGPLTMILKKKEHISKYLSPFETIGIRVPRHPLTQNLLNYLKKPLVGTSANFSGEKNPIALSDVVKHFNKKISAIIDGGVSEEKKPSTIISFANGLQILREGSISLDSILKVL